MFVKSSNTLKDNKKCTNRLAAGFTIVELLVVIVVIAILAAITVVSYADITKKATAATLQSDLKNASTRLEMDKTVDGTYPATKESSNSGKGLQTSSGTAFTYAYNDSNDSYALIATNNGISYHITSNNKVPVAGTISTTVNWEQVSTGYHLTCAVANGKAYCWGSGATPVAVDTSGLLSGKTVTAISAGQDYACAIADGKAYCWGVNYNSQLGNNSTVDSATPVAVDTSGVLSGKTVTAISAGYHHACAIADGKAYCWSNNKDYRGDGDSDYNIMVPTAVDTSGVLSGKTVTAISAGYQYTCAIANEQAYCWGSDSYGTLGGTYQGYNMPVAVDTSGLLSGKTVTAISAGHYHTCAIADNQAYCWGQNYNGLLGNGLTTDSYDIPVAVDTSGLLSGKTVTSISAGYYGTCVVASEKAYCWGSNNYGRIGNGSDDDNAVVLTPTAVVSTGVLSGKVVTSITDREDDTCIIANSQAYCWGDVLDIPIDGSTSSSSPVIINNDNIVIW